MSISKHLTAAIVAMFALFFGSVREVRAGVVEVRKDVRICRDLPMIKNLTGLKRQHVCEPITPPELTRREVRRLAARAATSQDHLAVAGFYRAEANGLDRRAAGYELAAAGLRDAPVAKNLVAPGTAARFEFAAEGFRVAAKVDRAAAVAHEKMAAAVPANVR
jgi:hypothetical protein